MVEASCSFILRYVSHDRLYYRVNDFFRQIQFPVFRQICRSGYFFTFVFICIFDFKKNNGENFAFINMGGFIKRGPDIKYRFYSDSLRKFADAVFFLNRSVIDLFYYFRQRFLLVFNRNIHRTCFAE